MQALISWANLSIYFLFLFGKNIKIVHSWSRINAYLFLIINLINYYQSIKRMYTKTWNIYIYTHKIYRWVHTWTQIQKIWFQLNDERILVKWTRSIREITKEFKESFIGRERTKEAKGFEGKLFPPPSTGERRWHVNLCHKQQNIYRLFVISHAPSKIPLKIPKL